MGTEEMKLMSWGFLGGAYSDELDKETPSKRWYLSWEMKNEQLYKELEEGTGLQEGLVFLRNRKAATESRGE